MFTIANNNELQPVDDIIINKSIEPRLDSLGFTKEQKDKYYSILNNFKTSYAKSNKVDFEDIRKRKNPAKPNYDEERLAQWLSNPSQYQLQLRQLSNYLYTTSAQYKSLIQYMSSKPTYDYTLIPISNPKTTNIKKMKQAYLDAAKYTDKIIQPTDLKKALTVAYKEDFVFAYECESDDSFFLFFLDAQFCQVTSIEDGVYNFAFDFAFFTGKEYLLEDYPKEFQQKYKKYKAKNDQELKWQELDSKKTFCIKVHDELMYPIIPFSTIFDDISDLDDYKRIKKIATFNDTFMALIQRIPLDEKNPDINKFLIDLDLAMTFHDMAAESVPDGVSLITSPMPIEAVKTTKGNVDSSNVQDAYATLYTDSGISQFLFNSDKNSSVGLAKSIVADDQLIFNVLRQIERWVNRKLKNLSGQYKFKVNFLDITQFNKEDVRNGYKDAASLGVPVKMEFAASVGLSPLDVLMKLELENNVLNLHEGMIPLQSSYTQTSNGEVGQGRDKVSDNKASDSTIVSRDRDSDSRKTDG